MGKKKIKLVEPIVVAGETVTELELGKSTIGDEEAAMQQAIELGRKQNDLTVEMCLYAILLKIPYETIKKMHRPDYYAIRKAHFELQGEHEEGESGPLTQSEA